MVNPPPKGRLRKGMYAQTSASTVAIANIIADVVRRVVFVVLVIIMTSKKKFKKPHGNPCGFNSFFSVCIQIIENLPTPALSVSG